MEKGKVECRKEEKDEGGEIRKEGRAGYMANEGGRESKRSGKGERKRRRS